MRTADQGRHVALQDIGSEYSDDEKPDNYEHNSQEMRHTYVDIYFIFILKYVRSDFSIRTKLVSCQHKLLEGNTKYLLNSRNCRQLHVKKLKRLAAT
jgi:hypothetical protein